MIMLMNYTKQLSDSMTLINQLYTAGLIQFGLFENQPFRLNLQLLPSYPHILKSVADSLSERINTEEFEKVVCPPDAVALTTLVSQKTGLSMVYSQGRRGSPVHDLVGAYDVGHPTLMIVNVWNGDRNLIDRAARVGLDIDKVISIISLVEGAESLLNLREIMNEVDLPSGQANAVHGWLDHNKTG